MVHEETDGLLHGKHSKRPWLHDYRASKAFTQLIVAVAVFTDDVLYGIVVPVFPTSLRERVGIPDDQVQRWVSIFLAIFGASQLLTALISGWVTDRSNSRQSVFMCGLLALTAATILLYIGNSLPILAIARAAQGVATAIVHTVGMSLVVDKSPPEELGRALGIIGASMTAAVLFGPLLGGILYKYAGYHAVFALSFALLGLDIILRLLMIEKPVSHQYAPKARGNGYGTGTSSGDGENGDDQASSHDAIGEPQGRSSDETNGVSPTSSDKSSAWIPAGVYLLASPRVLVCLLACLMNASMLTSFDSTLPIFVMRTFHWNSAKQGLIFLAIAIPTLFAPFTGYLSDKFGVRTLMTIGFVLAAPLYALLSLVRIATTEQEALLCVLLVLIGICLTLIHPATMAEVNHAVKAECQAHPSRYAKGGATGQANAIRNCAFSTGITLGPLYAGFVKERFGWTAMVSSIGVASLLTTPLVLLWAGGWLLAPKH